MAPLPEQAREGIQRKFLPSPARPTLSELFAAHPRDGGWMGFLLVQIDPAKPLLWVQERMAILESGRLHPPGLARLGADPGGGGLPNIIHVEARDARDSLWAMEEGLRCAGLSAVIGELWGDPRALDFTATRRLAVAAERSGTPCWLVRMGGTANLSGARMRWRVASAPSLANALDPRASGRPAWDAELFRARGFAPGRWNLSHDRGEFESVGGGLDGGPADRVNLVPGAGDRTMGASERRSA